MRYHTSWDFSPKTNADAHANAAVYYLLEVPGLLEYLIDHGALLGEIPFVHQVTRKKEWNISSAFNGEHKDMNRKSRQNLLMNSHYGDSMKYTGYTVQKWYATFTSSAD